MLGGMIDYFISLSVLSIMTSIAIWFFLALYLVPVFIKSLKIFEKNSKSADNWFTAIFLTTLIGGIFGIISFFVYYNPVYLGYSKAYKFEYFFAQNDILWAHDYLTISGKGRSSHYTRIHAIDLKTGERLFRQAIGQAQQLLAVRNDTLWYSNGYEIKVLKFPSGKILTEINKSNLLKINELKNGLMKDSWSRELKLNLKNLQIEVVNKEGFAYQIAPFDFKKINPISETRETEEYAKRENPLIKSGDLLQYDNAFKYTLEGQLRAKIKDSSGKILNPNLSFLYGKIIKVDEQSQNILVLSYETTDKKSFLLSNLNLQGKLKWQIKQSELKAGDILTFWYSPQFERAIIYKQDLLITLGGFMYSIRLEDGKINWQNRY